MVYLFNICMWQTVLLTTSLYHVVATNLNVKMLSLLFFFFFLRRATDSGTKWMILWCTPVTSKWSWTNRHMCFSTWGETLHCPPEDRTGAVWICPLIYCYIKGFPRPRRMQMDRAPSRECCILGRTTHHLNRLRGPTWTGLSPHRRSQRYKRRSRWSLFSDLWTGYHFILTAKYIALLFRNLSQHSCVRSSPWTEVWACQFPETVWALSRSPEFSTGHHPPMAHRSRRVDPRSSRNLSRSWRSPPPRAKRSPAAVLQPPPTMGSAGWREIKSQVARAGAWQHLPQSSLCLTRPLLTPPTQR